MLSYFFHPSSRSYEIAREVLAGITTCLLGAIIAVGGFHLALAQTAPPPPPMMTAPPSSPPPSSGGMPPPGATPSTAQPMSSGPGSTPGQMPPPGMPIGVPPSDVNMPPPLPGQQTGQPPTPGQSSGIIIQGKEGQPPAPGQQMWPGAPSQAQPGQTPPGQQMWPGQPPQTTASPSGQPQFKPGAQPYPPGELRGAPGQAYPDYRGGYENKSRHEPTPEDKKREAEYRLKYTGSNPDQGRQMPPGQTPPGTPAPTPTFDRGQKENSKEGSGAEEASRKRQEQDSEKRQKEEEKRRQEDMKRGLADMKRGLKQMSPMLKRMSDRVVSMEKSGLTIPNDIKVSLDAANKALKLILSAETYDDPGVQDAMESLQGIGQDLQEGMQKLEMLNNTSRMLKQANKEVQRVEAALVRTQKLAQRSKVDVSSQLQEFEAAVSTIKNAMEKARQQIASGDGEAAMETLQEDVFRKLEEAYQYEGLIRALQNIRSQIKQFERFVSNAKRMIARHEKQGDDTSDLKAKFDEMLTKLGELKQLIVQKNTSPDDLRDAMESLFELQQDLTERPAQKQSAEPKGEEQFQGFSFPSPGAGFGDR